MMINDLQLPAREEPKYDWSLSIVSFAVAVLVALLVATEGRILDTSCGRPSV